MAGAPFEVLLGAGAGKSVKLTYQSSQTSNPGGSGSTSFSWSTTLGVEDPNRYIVVTYNANAQCNSVTVGGVAAGQIAGSGTTSIWIARVPTGTTATVSLSTGADTGVTIAVYSLIASAPLSVGADATSDTSATTSGSIAVPNNGCVVATTQSAATASDSFTGGVSNDVSAAVNEGALNIGCASGHTSIGAAQTVTATVANSSRVVMAAWGPNDIVDQGQQYATFLSAATSLSGTFAAPTSQVIVAVCLSWADTVSPASAITSFTIGGHAATQIAYRVDANLVTTIYAAMLSPGDPGTYSVTGPSVSLSKVRTEAYKIDGFSRINAPSATVFSNTSILSTTLNVPATSAVIASLMAAGNSTPSWSGISVDDLASMGSITNSVTSAHGNFSAANAALSISCSGLGGSAAIACFAVFSP